MITSLVFLLSQMDTRNEGLQQAEFLIDAASRSFEQVKLERVPSDWERKKKGLKLCKLESRVRSLASIRGEMSEGVYEQWSNRENNPYLALYNPQRTAPEPISHAAYWAVTMFQRYVRFCEEDGSNNMFTGLSMMNPRILRRTLYQRTKRMESLVFQFLAPLDPTILGPNHQESDLVSEARFKLKWLEIQNACEPRRVGMQPEESQASTNVFVYFEVS